VTDEKVFRLSDKRLDYAWSETPHEKCVSSAENGFDYAWSETPHEFELYSL
jgi:hypothetical protein